MFSGVTRHAGLGRGVFLQAAEEIAREVRDQAAFARDGGIYWLAPASREGAAERRRPLDGSVYSGTMGIALFFALAAKVIDIPEYRALALHIVAPLRREIREIVPDAERVQQARWSLGGLLGLGSLIYGLVRLGDLLDEPALWDEALDLSVLITPESIAGDQHLEVMKGSAGAVLACLALDERRPGPNPAGRTTRELALFMAERLVEHRTSWLGSSGAQTLGFCHGTAGVACALERLALRAGRQDLRNAASEGWAFIEAAYDARIQNWRLPSRGGAPAKSWCNGAAGILLGGLARIAPGEPLDDSLLGALRTLQTSGIEPTDHLCCGNLGRVDVLVHASEKLNEPGIRHSAEVLAESVLERARGEGRYRLMLHPQDVVDTRLFPGATGVGYALLRLAAPGSLPSVLALG